MDSHSSSHAESVSATIVALMQRYVQLRAELRRSLGEERTNHLEKQIWEQIQLPHEEGGALHDDIRS